MNILLSRTTDHIRLKNTTLKITLSSICIVLTVLIGCSRVYLGVHYAGDVLGGWLLGFALSMLVYFLWDKKLPDKISQHSIKKQMTDT